MSKRLAEAGHLADDAIATTVSLADPLAKPLLVEGPGRRWQDRARQALATATDAELIRLQHTFAGP